MKTVTVQLVKSADNGLDKRYKDDRQMAWSWLLAGDEDNKCSVCGYRGYGGYASGYGDLQFVCVRHRKTIDDHGNVVLKWKTR